MADRGRARTPQPLIRRRLPSGRGATEQPNAGGDGPAALDGRFWAALVATGVAAGLFGDLMMLVLKGVEHLAYDYGHGTFQHAVESSSDGRRLACLLLGGLVGGTAWYLLRRLTTGERSDVDDVVWHGGSHLSWRRCLGTGLISELVVGMGASLGREQAPKLMGAASGGVLSGWLGLSEAQRRLVTACGAGAGLAAVYNVPLGGALFTMEVLIGSAMLASVLPAMACSVVATVTAWAYLPDRPTYPGVPAYHLSAGLAVFALLVGPFVALVATAYIRLIGWVSYRRPAGASLVLWMTVGFGALGLLGFAYPQLFGNGSDMAAIAFLGRGSGLLFLALFCLKPLATALCLRCGAAGGLFTPTMATGAVLGAALGLAWGHLWPGSPVGAYALIGAAAMIGASMQAPLAGMALVLELTRSGFNLVAPMMVATVVATIIARYLDGYSIYSARLPVDVSAS